MDMQEFTGNELRAGALRILRDRLDIIDPDRPRFDPGLLIGPGRYDPVAGGMVRAAFKALTGGREGGVDGNIIVKPMSCRCPVAGEWSALQSAAAGLGHQAMSLERFVIRCKNNLDSESLT